MIIVSQPRNSITNFDNITDIELEEYENKSWIIKCYTIDNKHIDLAIYKTEERAKEVLQEIIRTFSYVQLSGTYEEARLKMEIMKLGRYEMPEE